MEKLTERVLSFWFGSLKLQRALVAPIQPSMFKLWFGADTDTDRRIADEFGPSIRSIATDPALQDTLLATLDGAMALIILLDQMTRNAFRNTPESFAYDHIALRTTKLIVDRKWDHQLPAVYRGFAYLPLEHSENMEDQDTSVRLFKQLQDSIQADPQLVAPYGDFGRTCYDYAVRHREIIARFGRYPHRNAVLGRESTPEEVAYLDSGAETFGVTKTK